MCRIRLLSARTSGRGVWALLVCPLVQAAGPSVGLNFSLRLNPPACVLEVAGARADAAQPLAGMVLQALPSLAATHSPVSAVSQVLGQAVLTQAAPGQNHLPAAVVYTLRPGWVPSARVRCEAGQPATLTMSVPPVQPAGPLAGRRGLSFGRPTQGGLPLPIWLELGIQHIRGVPGPVGGAWGPGARQRMDFVASGGQDEVGLVGTVAAVSTQPLGSAYLGGYSWGFLLELDF